MKEGQNNTPSHTHVVANLIQQCADLTNNAKLNVVCAVCVLHAIVVVGSVSVSVDGVWCVCVWEGDLSMSSAIPLTSLLCVSVLHPSGVVHIRCVFECEGMPMCK